MRATSLFLLLLAGCYTVGTPDDDTADDDAADDDASDDDASDDDASDDDASDDDASDDDASDDDVGDDDAGDDDTLPPGTDLACLPVHSAASVAAGTPTLVQLSAQADLGNGLEPVSDGAWVVASGGGSVSATGLYTSPSDHGGVVEVQVLRAGLSATCTIELDYDETDDRSGLPGVADGFAAASPVTDPGCAATLVYPLDGSIMPGTFAPPLVQWTGGGSVHELTLASDHTVVRFVTTADAVQPTEAQWAALTEWDPGITVTATVASGSWSGGGFSGQVCTTTGIGFGVTDFGIGGSVVYWAPPVTKRIDVGGLNPANSTVALPPAICHGCHNVNLANPMRMSYGPNVPSTTSVIDLSAPSTQIINVFGDYGALDPTGQFIAVGGMFGGLTLYSATTGQNRGVISSQSSATMPTWSPDGTTLVYAVCDAPANALQGAHCDLYKQTWNPATSTFSGETLVVAHSGQETLYYPTFSPDSQWIAYNHATPLTTADGTTWSNANPTATLRLVHISGSPNLQLASASGFGDLTNSWPRWAPQSGDLAWLAWSSTRAYGHQVEDRPQLWVSGIDLVVAASGADPSFPPVWLPGQLISEGNHTPTWVPRLQ